MADVTTVKFDGKVGIFKLNDGAQLRDISPYILSLRGLPGQFKVDAGATPWGSTGERPFLSLQMNHFTLELLVNQITDVGTLVVLDAMWSAKALRAFEYYPLGEVQGQRSFTGSVYLPVLELTSQSGAYQQYHAEFHADNGITVGTKA